jgi:hypothetical protein
MLRPEMDEVLAHCICGSLEPARMHEGLLGCQDLDETLGKGIEGIGPRNVEMERGRIILGEDIYLIEVGIDAIRDRNIDDSVLSPEGNGRFGAILSEGEEPGAFTSAENNGKNLGHGTTPDSRAVYRLRIAAITDTV